MTGPSNFQTADARALRSRRQRWAAPGGSHDRLVRVLGTALPMLVGVIAALMIISPLSPRGEISFLLDRNKVAMIKERLRLDDALYRGADNDGRPFSLTAASAVQASSREGIVRMEDVVARMLLSDGPARMTAEGGQYALADQRIAVAGPMRVEATDGYRIRVDGVTLDMKAKTLEGANGVEGMIPAGTFRADRLTADLSARTITLSGNARLRMIPGKLRMP